MKMADKKKNSGESKAEEMKGKLSEAKETVKEEIDDYKEKASEGMDAVKEKTSEVLKTVKGETEEETDCRIFFTFALMAALGSGCLAHKGGDNVSIAVLLGGESQTFSSDQKFSRCFHLLCLCGGQQPIQEEEVEPRQCPECENMAQINFI